MKAIATGMMSANVLADALSDDPQWQSAGIAETLGRPLVEIATVLQIDPADLNAALKVLVESQK
ncbi:hypothetical protein A1D31_35425 [Bradyrhizobium liaoningense]|nr:hypothetical protein A1D31_35425 [Bradyrhizobium liaoningense]